MKATTVAIAIAALTSVVKASEFPDYPFVFAREQVTTEVAPDICFVSYRVKVRDSDSANAIESLDAQSEATLNVLSEHGIKREDIVGHEINKDVIRDYEKREQVVILGYEITRRFRFTLRDLGQFAPIVTALLKTDNVTDVDSDFDRVDREDVESRLLVEAIAKARAKAELLAKGSGQKIVGLRAVSEYGFDNLYQQFTGLSGRGGEFTLDPGELLVPSTIRIGSGVSVMYEIAE